MRGGIGLLAFAQGDSAGEVTRLWRTTGENEVTEAGQAQQGFRFGAVGFTEAHQLRKTTRGERRGSASAQPFSRYDSCSNCKNVLGGTAKFDAAHICRMVGPESARIQRVGQIESNLAIGRCNGDRCGQSVRNVSGKAWPGQDCRQ